ncbi:MAG: hypothetical protein ACTSR8_22490 [Promethearchaeota archaeon]
MSLIYSLLLEFGPCSTTELLDFLNSDLYLHKGLPVCQDFTRSKLRYQLNKFAKNNKEIFKFRCENGFKVRFGTTIFKYYLPYEPRSLKVQGYLKPCIFCGMPIYINQNKVFHFKYKCSQYQEQEYFRLLKLENFWAIISRDFVYGILDNLHSYELRLPGPIKNKTNSNIKSELWLINDEAREREIIEPDRILPVKAEEFIV